MTLKLLDKMMQAHETHTSHSKPALDLSLRPPEPGRQTRHLHWQNDPAARPP